MRQLVLVKHLWRVCRQRAACALVLLARERHVPGEIVIRKPLAARVFTLAAGDANVVAVSRWRVDDGRVVADAVRITKV